MNDHEIDLDTATQLTANYRAAHPGQNETLSMEISWDALKLIKDQNGCDKLRIYFGLNDQGEKQLVLVGLAGTTELYNGVILDRCAKNPPYSSPTPLNS